VRRVLDEPKQGVHVGMEAYRSYMRHYKPSHWFFGHIHECYGRARQYETEFYNVAMCDRNYDHVNPPMVVDL
jgi:Icc-related predicted phosphoesterase